jgi:NAD(P)H-hydrate repair Nnr-like enzyme with NAD(P)H-hydrate dehydratase domain
MRGKPRPRREPRLAVDPPAASARVGSASRRAADIRTYLDGRALRAPSTSIRSESARAPVVTPHRHEFFQIFANIAGHAPHLIAGRRLACAPRSLVFVLPYRVHLAP